MLVLVVLLVVLLLGNAKRRFRPITSGEIEEDGTVAITGEVDADAT